MSKAVAIDYNNSKTNSVIGVDIMDKKEIDWTDWSAHDNCAHIPNAETIAAIEETEEIIRKIKAGTDTSPSYTCFAELLAEIDAELEEEGYAIHR